MIPKGVLEVDVIFNFVVDLMAVHISMVEVFIRVGLAGQHGGLHVIEDPLIAPHKLMGESDPELPARLVGGDVCLHRLFQLHGQIVVDHFQKGPLGFGPSGVGAQLFHGFAVMLQRHLRRQGEISFPRGGFADRRLFHTAYLISF